MSAATATKKFSASIEFTKDAGATADDGTLSIKGYASTWLKDRDGEYVEPDAFDKSWDRFIGKNPMMLYQHNPDWPIGYFADGIVDDHGLFVDGRVPTPKAGEIPEVVTAYNKIAAGVLRTYSISGIMEKTVKAGEPRISNVDLFEISVVTIPANEDSLFAAAKRLALGEAPSKMAPHARAQMEQLLGFRPMTDPELEVMTPEEVEDHWTALSELFKSTYGASPPPRDAWLRVLKAKNGGVAVPIVARAGLEVVRSFYQPEAPATEPEPEAKAGRVLSKRHEKHLHQAVQHIQTVLYAVTPADEDNDDDSKEAGAPVDNPPLAPAIQAAAGLSASARRAQAKDAKTYSELQSALRAAVQDAQPKDDDGDIDYYCWVEDFSDDWVIYSAEGGKLYRRGYERDVDGNVKLTGEPVEVRPVTTYQELAVEFDHAGQPFLDLGSKGALPVRKLTVASKDQSWDASKARGNVKDWSDSTDAPSSKYAQAFLYREGDGANYEDYKFIVADVIDGKLQYVPKAIYAAAAVVQGGRAGTSEEIASAIKPKLATLYGMLANKFEDDSIKPPWESE